MGADRAILPLHPRFDSGRPRGGHERGPLNTEHREKAEGTEKGLSTSQCVSPGIAAAEES